DSAREDVEKKRKLAYQQAQVMAEQQKEALRALHYMKCPKCGFDLQTLRRGTVDLDTCFNCHGVWLDAGELEQVAAQQLVGKHSVVDAVLNVFRAGKRTP